MKKILALLFLLSINLITQAQIKNEPQDTLFVAFWNLQNLFDTEDDPLTKDEEFLPSAEKEWTQERLDKKLYNLSRVIRLMNDGKGPDVIGVCEVEHKALLDSMVKKFLPDLDYDVVYAESPDERGIDNGLIFKKNIFNLNNVFTDTVLVSADDQTRLILNVNLTFEGQNIYFFVNHFPSRGGGEIKSEPKRIKAAETLRKSIDEILKNDSNAKIIVIGDFNDEPDNNSITKILLANHFFCDSLMSKSADLFNLSYQSFSRGIGSYKYKDDWNMIDQIIVSENLIYGKYFNYVCGSFEVFKPYLLQTHTGKFQGTAFPTYGGNRYLGGFSDHYPVTSKFELIKK